MRPIAAGRCTVNTPWDSKRAVLLFVEPAASSKTANLAGDRYRGPGGCRVQHEAPTVGDRRRHDDRRGRLVEGEVTPEAIVSNRRSSASAGESTIVEGL